MLQRSLRTAQTLLVLAAAAILLAACAPVAVDRAPADVAGERATARQL
jgi:hypothetical protein